MLVNDLDGYLMHFSSCKPSGCGCTETGLFSFTSLYFFISGSGSCYGFLHEYDSLPFFRKKKKN